MSLTRRRFCTLGVGLSSIGLAGCLDRSSDEAEAEADPGPDVEGWTWSGSIPVDTATQYHDSGCGCCVEYVEYLEAHGIDVTIEEVDDLAAVKTELSVPDELRSCHTTVVGDYLVEGHVPLEAVEALFDDDDSALGIAIPGMPQHAPGMGPPADERLQVYAFTADGDTAEHVTV